MISLITTCTIIAPRTTLCPLNCPNGFCFTPRCHCCSQERCRNSLQMRIRLCPCSYNSLSYFGVKASITTVWPAGSHVICPLTARFFPSSAASPTFSSATSGRVNILSTLKPTLQRLFSYVSKHWPYFQGVFFHILRVILQSFRFHSSVAFLKFCS